MQSDLDPHCPKKIIGSRVADKSSFDFLFVKYMLLSIHFFFFVKLMIRKTEMRVVNLSISVFLMPYLPLKTLNMASALSKK